jgi:ABC-type transport system involved in multi-copper enzyme maturation permease subunit
VTRVFGVELRRAVARRTTHVIAGLALLGIVIAVIVVLIRSGHTTVVFFPDGSVRPIRQYYFLTTLTDTFRGTSILCIVLAGVLGATLVGAEWHTGSMTTTLTWEPRRVLLWIGKVLAAAVVVFALILLLQIVLGLLLTVVAALRGSTAGTDATWLARTIAIGLRVALLSAMAGTMAAAVAMVGRNTAAALGIGAIYLGVVEGLIGGLRPGWQPWLIGVNLISFVGNPDGTPFVPGRSMVGAGMLLAIYAVGLAIVAGAVFRARDVT